MADKKMDHGGHNTQPAIDPKIIELTQPPKGQKFMKREVEKVAESIARAEIGDKHYLPEEVMTWTKNICQDVQQRVSEMGYERYKTVVQVTITESAGQGIRVASRCLWDPDTDNYAEVVISTEYLHCVVLVFGLYWE
eukprot:PhM_4_TR9825/c3_g1_i1/m.73403